LRYCNSENTDNPYPNKLKLLGQKVGAFFGKTDEFQLLDVYEFLDQLDDISGFEESFNEYVTFKDYSNESIPRFKTFREDWDQQNWGILLEQLKYKDTMSKIDSF
jgi:hypothetical protein